MDRPKKFKYIVSTPNKKEDRFKFHEDFGYNKAIDDYELWLEEVASVENISRVIEMFTMQEMYGTELAKAISEMIIGK